MSSEPFPTMSPLAHVVSRSDVNSNATRRRRKSSTLGADPRGDTGANALATSDLKQPTPPRTNESNQPSKGRKRRKAKRLVGRTKRLCLKHTWIIPLALTLTILACYFVYPGEQNPLHSAIFLSYANPPLNERTDTLPAHIGNVTQYGKGPKDFAFVAFYTIVLSFTREFLMQRLIRPLGLAAGIQGKNKLSRFMEQCYAAIYCALFGPFGVWIMSRTPVWYFNTAGMYAGFPHRAHESYFKAYYLLEAAFWAQQGLVLMLQLEKPRKDFKELVLHHIITLALIGLSYRFHFTYMGIAVYITHDISDFFLATSKILNYLDSILVGPYFVSFVFIWGYMRHYINLRILYSLSPFAIPGLSSILPNNEFATVGNYVLDFSTQQYKCWISQAITFPLLAALQAVNLFWYFLIWRILYRIVFTGVQKDDRSDDEEEDEDEEVTVEARTHKAKISGSRLGPPIGINGKPLGGKSHQNGTLVGGETTGIEGVGGRKSTLRKKR